MMTRKCIEWAYRLCYLVISDFRCLWLILRGHCRRFALIAITSKDHYSRRSCFRFKNTALIRTSVYRAPSERVGRGPMASQHRVRTQTAATRIFATFSARRCYDTAGAPSLERLMRP